MCFTVDHNDSITKTLKENIKDNGEEKKSVQARLGRQIPHSSVCGHFQASHKVFYFYTKTLPSLSHLLIFQHFID